MKKFYKSKDIIQYIKNQLNIEIDRHRITDMYKKLYGDCKLPRKGVELNETQYNTIKKELLKKYSNKTPTSLNVKKTDIKNNKQNIQKTQNCNKNYNKKCNCIKSASKFNPKSNQKKFFDNLKKNNKKNFFDKLTNNNKTNNIINDFKKSGYCVKKEKNSLVLTKEINKSDYIYSEVIVISKK